MMEGDPQLGPVCPICGLSVREEEQSLHASVQEEPGVDVQVGPHHFLEVIPARKVETRVHGACFLRVAATPEPLEYE